MTNYRTRPIVVQALHYRGPEDLEKVKAMVGSYAVTTYITEGSDPAVVVEIHNGGARWNKVWLLPDHWLVKTPDKLKVLSIKDFYAQYESI